MCPNADTFPRAFNQCETIEENPVVWQVVAYTDFFALVLRYFSARINLISNGSEQFTRGNEVHFFSGVRAGAYKILCSKLGE
jgi:hypothetical protein